MRTKTLKTSLLAAVLCTALVACGSDSSDDEGAADPAPSSSTTAATGAPEPVAGCEDAQIHLAVDPENEPARCEPGSPAPQPLAEERKVVLSLPSMSTESVAVWLYGQAKGEFEKENIDLEIQVAPSADAYTLASQGQVDVVWTGPHAIFFNLLGQDFDMRWVGAGYYSADESKRGFWAPAGTTPASLKGKTIATAGGNGLTNMYGLSLVLAEGDLTLNDVEYAQVSNTDSLAALQNGAVDAASIVDPFWTELDGDPDWVFLGNDVPPAEPTQGFVYSAGLLEDREAGLAVMRAYMRTVNTYFQSGYKDDPAFVAELAEVLGSTPEVIEADPEIVWDWNVRQGTADRLQETFRVVDALNYGEDLPESDVVDRSFVAGALGLAVPED